MKDIFGISRNSRRFFACGAAFSAALCLLCGCKDIDSQSGEAVTAATASELVTSESVSEVTVLSEGTTTTLTEETTEISSEETTEEFSEETTEQSTTVSEQTTDEETSATAETTAEQTTTVQTTTEQTTASEQTTAEEITTTTTTTTEQTTTETEIITTSETTVTVQETTVQTESMAAAEVPSYFQANRYNALNFAEQKGFWISYLEFDHMLKNKSKEEFTAEIGRCFDNVKALGFNTVYTHVRAFGDAYYDSSLFPATNRFNGTYGVSGGFDPLKIMVQAAHDRGLSIHAWINPMRLMSEGDIGSISAKYKIGEWYASDTLRGQYIVKVNGTWYLNPGYKATVQLIADGVSEIVSNYNVDGVQIDDYFYPTTEAYFDSAAYAASGTGKSLSEWRTGIINNMVRQLYSAVKSSNPTAVFGISPQGSIENNYNDLYADVKTWCSSSGYVDYILPQIYYGFNNSTLPYKDTCLAWSKMVTSPSVKLVIGLAPYKIGIADNWAGDGKYEWANSTDTLARQMSYAQTLSNYGGVAMYRYDSLFAPSNDVAKAVNAELANIPR